MALLLLALYVANFGLLLWMDANHYLPGWAERPIAVVYWPMLWLAEFGPQPLRDAILWYYAACTGGDTPPAAFW